MSPLSSKFAAGIAVLIFSGVSAHAADAAQQHRVKKNLAKAEQATPAPQPPPPPPPTLEQMPASAPQVTFRNGMLTIVSQNSTLADILRAVHARTGAAMDIPPNANERVVSRLGPGPAREVLASLLNGSHFNYVMLGSATNPESVERVILTSKASAPATGIPSPPVGQNQADQQSGVMQEAPEEMTSDDAAADENTEQEGQPENSGEDQQQQPNGQPVVKTPEQLLRELQQQQQQQQQPGAPQGFPVPPNQPPEQQQPPQ
jgi:hypothetical protein